MKLVSTALALVLLCGCRDDGGGTVKPDGPPVVTENKIQDVQNDAVADGTKIKLDGVIVTAIDAYGGRTGNFYVQEPEGGPYSGVLVFGAKLSDVAQLSVGDIVNLDGMEKDEFLPPNDASLRTITELKPVTGGVISITKVGSGQPPAPAVLDALAVAAMPAAMAEAEMEKWEGVLVTISNVTQLYDPRPASSSDQTFFEFSLNGGITVDTSLTAFPATSVADACYTSITGMGDYFYSYKVLPRSAADIVVGTGCPAVETTTIPEIQAGSYARTGPVPDLVRVNDVYITGVAGAGNFKSVWAAQSLTAARNEGVNIFVGSGIIPGGVNIGAKVNLVGTVVEFDNTGSTGAKLTELIRPSIRVIEAPSTLPTPITDGPVSEVGNIGAAGNPYESTLVQLAGLKVMALGANNTVVMEDKLVPANTITIDDAIFAYTPTDFTVGACYTTVTGIASINTIDDKRILLPRATTDLVPDASGAACMP
ncbi:MAG: hypothetical protein R3B48_04525 [Kofleriaceae bacterium]